MANFNWPSITTQPAPIQYEENGTPTTVSKDTVTPANSTPLPVEVLNAGAPFDFSTLAQQATLATRASETTVAAVDTKIGSVIQTGSGDTFFAVGGRDGGPNWRAIHVDTNGDVQVDLASSLPAGTNNIGDVDVLTLPPLPAGTNNIGDVDVLTLPPLPAGTNNIGDVDVLTLPSIPAGTNNIGDVDVLTLPVSYNAGNADAQTLRVIPASDYVPPAQSGRTVVTTHRRDYSVSSVTTGAWVELVSSLGSTVNEIEIFDSSGQTLELGTGAAASETRLLLVFPGGNGRASVRIASGTRISLRAVSGTANVGEIDINFYS